VQPVILDTDVASLTHKRKLTAPLATRLIGRKPLITFVTFGELTKWTEIRHWGTRSRQELADWLSGIPILPGDEPVAAMWGRLSAAGIQRGRPRPKMGSGKARSSSTRRGWNEPWSSPGTATRSG
jgi:predicted nucleic acid-binding protein